MITRDTIANAILKVMKESPLVRAGWEIGAVAFNRVDEWSDVDLCFDVKDDHFEEVYAAIEAELTKIAPIECKHGAPNGIAPGAYQTVYKLEGISEFLFVEICFIPWSAKNKAVQKEIHGDIIVHFDEEGVLKGQKVDLDFFVGKLERRLAIFRKLYVMYQFMVRKEIYRRNPVEAYFYYYSVAVRPMLELVRMHYYPFRHDFEHRYVYYELPKEVAKEIEEFVFCKDLDDLSEKHEKLLMRYLEELEYLESLDIRKHLESHM